LYIEYRICQQPEFTMTEVSTAEARDRLAELINRATYAGERVILTRRGKALAAIVPIADVELLEALEERVDLAEARDALAEARESGTVSLQALKNELGLP
jgi:prevent-host-death family protein